MPDLLDLALGYAGRGWRVFLLQPGDKVPIPARHTCSGAPHRHGFLDATVDLSVLRGWWGAHPTANVGIATGRRSGLFVVDEDPRHGGDETLADLISEHRDWPITPTVRTSGGGHHFLFRYPADADPHGAKLGPGVDLKHDGGYIVGAGSVHPDGPTYRWEEGRSPDDVPLVPPPEWILLLMASRPGRRQAGAKQRAGRTAAEAHVIDPMAPVPEGERAWFLSKAAGVLRFHGLEEPAVDRILRTVRDFHCEPGTHPVPDAEVARIAKLAVRDLHVQAKTAPRMQLTDALLERFLVGPMPRADIDELAATFSVGSSTVRRVLVRLKRARIVDGGRVSVGGHGEGYWRWGLLDDVGFSGRPLADPLPDRLIIEALRIVGAENAAYRQDHGADLYPRSANGRFLLGLAGSKRLQEVVDELRGIKRQSAKKVRTRPPGSRSAR